MAVIYVGDPMCSWCWGIAPELKALERDCAARHLPFRVVVGGLRPGGGDPWNGAFKQFLAHHWEEIERKTGQPFSFGLLERESFDYDTEPACRAVVAARPLIDGSELHFFSAIQRRFYVDNEDPNPLEFYRALCTEFEIDFGTFTRRFNSDAVKLETRQEFRLNRDWGVTGYPTVLLQAAGTRTQIAVGFATFAQLRDRIQQQLTRPA